jgi:(S)-2-hydroxyglutarate dehydrogenase
MVAQPYDVAIVGGGIVGLATALALNELNPALKLVVLEKEPSVARHQTGHNSGVIHAGIYYKPGSYKARLCVEGVRLMTAYCDASGIPYRRCGKVIVATSEAELPRLESLYERGRANGVPGLEMIDAARLREIEPHAGALRAIYSPTTSIVDFAQVGQTIAARLLAGGLEILTGLRVRRIRRADGSILLEGERQTVAARNIINCAGLYADAIARLMDIRPNLRIIPFRGEFYVLRPGCNLVRGLIYPVPDPQFPFLGVHFTPRIQGGIEAGPNAVLAFALEGYRMRDIHVGEALGMVAYRGFWAMVGRYWQTGLYEFYRSLSRRAFVRALQRLVPELQPGDVSRGGSGVRAQAVSPDGLLVDDFSIVEVPNAIHVLNAPSPAATASLAIGRHIAGLASRSFDLGK